MKYFRPISLMAALWLTSVPVFCQLPCEANFLNSVELRGQELTLADVLRPRDLSIPAAKCRSSIAGEGSPGGLRPCA